MKYGTAKFIDWIILKPIALIYAPCFILYGIFSGQGYWIHVVIGILGIMVSGGIGQRLYPKAQPSDLSSGRAWEVNGPDNEEQAQEINTAIKQKKI